ncbi:hypothetical protein BGZ93_004246 [Podila epicladia]|nr:hypothetical protein BGZ93_004246 [Podila epicladia]
MAFRYSYSPEIKHTIRQAILSYLEVLGYEYAEQIGYAQNIEQLLKGYAKCNVHPGTLIELPYRSRNRSGANAAEPLGAAHLLEKIFHAVFVQRQQDRTCPCGRFGRIVHHAEIFDFEPGLGFRTNGRGPTFASKI